jgi:hypothetical protein
MVLTRTLDGELMAGRLKVIHAIRANFQNNADLVMLRLPSAITDRSVTRLLSCGWVWLTSLLRGAPLPLQCALFSSPQDIDRLVRSLPNDLDAVYVDGVRSLAFVEALRKLRPELRQVVDLDDLMSLRMSLLLGTRQPLSPGYLTKKLPKPLLRLTMSPALGRLIVRYERATLLRAERKLAGLADVLALVAAEDANKLRQARGLPTRAKIEVVPPPSAPPRPFGPLGAPLRAVFIGSDSLTQNRLTIDYLIELWRREKPALPLVFFGLWNRAIDLPPNVETRGYVEDLDDVYDGHSILITPSRIGGGIKTKVLEGFARAAPVVGNALTFESMNLADYPLLMNDEAELVALLRAPEKARDRFEAGRALGARYLRQHHDPETFNRRWMELMTGAPSVAKTPTTDGHAADGPAVYAMSRSEHRP